MQLRVDLIAFCRRGRGVVLIFRLPHLGARAEVLAEPQRRVGGNRPAALDDSCDAAHRHIDLTRQLVLANAQRAQEFLEQDLARGNRFKKLSHDHHFQW
jgi:hypothetical protein